jgi:hypothetical protein
MYLKSTFCGGGTLGFIIVEMSDIDNESNRRLSDIIDSSVILGE